MTFGKLHRAEYASGISIMYYHYGRLHGLSKITLGFGRASIAVGTREFP